jgi:hypothetical protein
MRKILVLTLVLTLGLAAFLWAADAPKKAEVAKAPVAKLTGEVICLSCYMDHEAMGDKHAACAAACAKRGVPLGILEDQTGNVYAVVKGHSGANETLAPFAGKRATLTGKWFERGNSKVFNLETAAEAK